MGFEGLRFREFRAQGLGRFQRVWVPMGALAMAIETHKRASPSRSPHVDKTAGPTELRTLSLLHRLDTLPETNMETQKGPIKTTVPLKGDYMGFPVSLGECMADIYGMVRDSRRPR